MQSTSTEVLSTFNPKRFRNFIKSTACVEIENPTTNRRKHEKLKPSKLWHPMVIDHREYNFEPIRNICEKSSWLHIYILV